MTAPGTRRTTFRGRIAGVGSASGVRVVVGWWHDSPLGSFADAMVALPSGHRVLVAPDLDVARFVAGTYSFDEIRIEPITVDGPAPGEVGSWQVRSPSLTLDLETGRRAPLGWLLRAVPRRLAESPAWCSVTDPVARVVLQGVRTRGDTGDRREWYAATDHHRVVTMTGSYDGQPLGALRAVEPPPAFGFSSTPPRPSVTAVATTVELAADVPLVGPAAP
ncbi:MAG: hypothetical protein CMH83_15045 [Nocardioides sp.]|nr:hypothetical protein [Nocardioides sp.]